LYPPVVGVLTGAEGFSPDRQLRSVMSIGGVLMAGWAVLLVWAVRRPIERRFVILLTALVVAALFLSVLISVWEGNSDEYWILVKCVVLVAAMLISSSLAGAMDRTAADL
jgi:peptidoglycan/LPS O-acetylase OafA/YrhL